MEDIWNNKKKIQGTSGCVSSKHQISLKIDIFFSQRCPVNYTLETSLYVIRLGSCSEVSI